MRATPYARDISDNIHSRMQAALVHEIFRTTFPLFIGSQLESPMPLSQLRLGNKSSFKVYLRPGPVNLPLFHINLQSC
jgi:hypothetical protein